MTRLCSAKSVKVDRALGWVAANAPPWKRIGARSAAATEAMYSQRPRTGPRAEGQRAGTGRAGSRRRKTIPPHDSPRPEVASRCRTTNRVWSPSQTIGHPPRVRALGQLTWQPARSTNILTARIQPVCNTLYVLEERA